jgi:hypothetical protein
MTGRAGGALLALLAALAGCTPSPPPPTDTGAREAAVDFFDGLVRQDWGHASGALEADSRARCDAARFARLARAYRAGLGFEPTAAHVRACEEHGAEATAHVVLTGGGPSHARRFRESVVLRRGPSGWGVVLPARFGQTRRP